MTKKNQSERKGRRSRDTAPEYNTVDLITKHAADLKNGGLRYLLGLILGAVALFSAGAGES